MPLKQGNDFITQALYADAFRGWDSTGLIAIRSGKVETHKRALPAADFILTRPYKRITNTLHDAYIGHNRAATVGKVVDETAHPFQHGHIVGVHNGTLDMGWRNKLPQGTTFEVDSDALIHSIYDIGVERTVEMANGAFAVVYYDIKANTVNMIRNKERPLYYGLMNYKSENRWVFGSEAGLLEWIAERNDNHDPLKDIWELDAGQLLTIDAATGKDTLTAMTVAGRSTYNAPFQGGRRSTSNSYNPRANKTSTGTAGADTKSPIIYLPHEKKALDKHSISTTSPIEFWPVKWEAYSGHELRGVLRGIASTSPYMEVVLYNVGHKEVDMSKEYSADVVSIRRRTGVTNSHKELSDLASEDLEVVLQSASLCEIVPATDVLPKAKAPNVLTLPDKREPKGPNGEKLTRFAFDQLTDKGCSCCGDNLIYRLDNVHWTIDNQPLCDTCFKELAESAVTA